MKDLSKSQPSQMTDSEKVLDLLSLLYLKSKIDHTIKICTKELSGKDTVFDLEALVEKLDISTGNEQADNLIAEYVDPAIEILTKDVKGLDFLNKIGIGDLFSATKEDNRKLYNARRFAEGLTENWVRQRHQGGPLGVVSAYATFAGAAAGGVIAVSSSAFVAAGFLIGAVGSGVHKWAINLIKNHGKHNAIGQMYQAQGKISKELEDKLSQYHTKDGSLRISKKDGNIVITRFQNGKLHCQGEPALIVVGPNAELLNSEWFHNGTKTPILSSPGNNAGLGERVLFALHKEWSKEVDSTKRQKIEDTITKWKIGPADELEGDWVKEVQAADDLITFVDKILEDDLSKGNSGPRSHNK